MVAVDCGLALPPVRGIDPLHPLLEAFAGDASELQRRRWRVGGGVYLYVLDGADGPIQVGATRNPHHRFFEHQRAPWWSHVTTALVYRIDCRWHEGPPCSVPELDHAARYLEDWLIDLFEPEQQLAGPIS